jgi:hypothetical protein
MVSGRVEGVLSLDGLVARMVVNKTGKKKGL